MSPYVQVRAGAQWFLLPSSCVGEIGVALPRAAGRRVLDARRLDPAQNDRGRERPVALEWRRPSLVVLVDGVEGLVSPDPRDLMCLPQARTGLGSFFDAAWYDRTNGRFLLRVRADAAAAHPGRCVVDLIRRLRPERT